MARIYALINGDTTASPLRTLNIIPVDADIPDYDTRSIRANGAGVIACLNADGTAVTANFLAGETRIMCVRRILATGTTATGIEASF